MKLLDFEQPRPARDVLPKFWTDNAAIRLVQQWCDDGLFG